MSRECKVAMAQVLNLIPPEPFNVRGEPTTVYQRWRRWKRTFEYYLSATNIEQAELVWTPVKIK